MNASFVKIGNTYLNLGLCSRVDINPTSGTATIYHGQDKACTHDASDTAAVQCALNGLVTGCGTPTDTQQLIAATPIATTPTNPAPAIVAAIQAQTAALVSARAVPA